MGILDFLKKKDGQSSTPSQAEVSPELQEFLAKDPYEAQQSGLSPSGLYPHEVLLLSFAPSLYTDQQEFPLSWRQQYGLLNIPKLLFGLVERGFIEAATLEATLEGETVAGLKKALRACGLSVSGRKAELISRIGSDLSDADLVAHFSRRTFALTQSGLGALHEAIYIPYLHKKPVEGLTIWGLHQLVKSDAGTSYRDLIYGHMERHSQIHLDKKDFTAYRAMRYRMYQFMLEDNKRKKAFPLLAEAIYYDLSGVGSEADSVHRYISEKYFFPYDKSIVKLPAAVVSGMAKLQKDLALSDEMLRALLMQFFGQYSTPFHLFTSEECAHIVLFEIHGDKEKLHKVYELAEARFGQV